MGFIKRVYTDKETVITAENLNEMQDAILDLEDGLFSVDNDKSGEVIAITDAAKRGFRSLNIYGKTTQDGTPTPDAPVGLVSVGNSDSICVAVSEKNIFKYVGNALMENGNIVESTPSGCTVQGIDGGVATGSTAWSNGWVHFDRASALYLTKGAVITLSADYTLLERHPSAIDKVTILLEYGSGATTLDIANAEIGVKYRISKTFVIPNDGEYKRTTFTTHSSKVKIENVQWEIGSTASDFVPYRENTFSVSTPNGLLGIPVTSGGNYTDSNGQQWICDEIDFTRGVYVQRCKEIVIDGTGSIAISQHTNSQRYCAQAVPDILALTPPDIPKMVMSDRYEAYAWTDQNNRVYCIGDDIIITDNRFTDRAATIAVLQAEKPKVVYVLATPIETPLTEEELAAYSSLHTYKDHTTVFNDAGTYMELEYVMDAKKYIDSLVGVSAKLSSVTLPASKWVTGADSLHSQVVIIPGITEYSKVDLLPSVEQLAIFHNKDVTFVTENEDGVVTVYAIGDKPLLDYTMQVSITEVVV